MKANLITNVVSQKSERGRRFQRIRWHQGESSTEPGGRRSRLRSLARFFGFLVELA